MGCAAGNNLYLEEPFGRATLAYMSVATFNTTYWLVGNYSIVRDRFPRNISHPVILHLRGHTQAAHGETLSIHPALPAV